jgi:hypothetical protein
LCEALRASIPPEFRALARFSVPEVAEIKAEITNLATKLRQIVRLKYQGSPCLLALDGGTLHRTTLLNFMLLSVRPNSTPLFVVSRQVRDLTAATIKKTISEVASLVREVFGMIPVGIVSDNASAMARAIEDYDEDDDDAVAGAAMFHRRAAGKRRRSRRGRGRGKLLRQCPLLVSRFSTPRRCREATANGTRSLVRGLRT